MKIYQKYRQLKIFFIKRKSQLKTYLQGIAAPTARKIALIGMVFILLLGSANILRSCRREHQSKKFFQEMKKNAKGLSNELPSLKKK